MEADCSSLICMSTSVVRILNDLSGFAHFFVFRAFLLFSFSQHFKLIKGDEIDP